MSKRDERRSVDVVVVGFGGAGAVAALEAHDAGAEVLVLEKTPHFGGTTMLCSGYFRIATGARGAADYLRATSDGRVAEPLIQQLAQGMTEVWPYLEQIGRVVGAKMHLSIGADQASYETSDLYDWPGRDALGWAGIDRVPGFEGYPWVHFASHGEHLMRALEANVAARGIAVWLGAPATRLVIEDGRVAGVAVARDGAEVELEARGGVVLACGGFEFDAQLLRDALEIPAVYGMGHPGNDGDGIRLAQQAGAALWHLWHFHGSYGFKFSDFPMAFRNHLGGSRRSERAVAWIVVNKRGRRFMSEVHPAPQDTMWRPLQHLDEETGTFDRIPSWMVFDDAARQLGPVGKPVAAVPEHYYEWSRDNMAEVQRGWIVTDPTIRGLAAKMAVPSDALAETISRWNASVARGCDEDFGRPPGTFVPVATPPFYAVPVWPVCSNTQGGPRHDELQRVLDGSDRPIPGLYAVGELGSFFGHIYLLGGNLTEAVVGGRIAGRQAAQGPDRAPVVAAAGTR